MMTLQKSNISEIPAVELAQIDHINTTEVPQLAEKLPYDCWYKNTFRRENDLWRFQFECNYVAGQFNASALGRTPREAFALTKHLILKQLSDWHKTRFIDVIADEPVLASIMPAALRVLIVDDDVDSALALQTAFKQMGYQTEVATRFEDLHRTIVAGAADYIFLDWTLNDNVTGGQVVEKAIRLIDTFADLREKFTVQRPRVVTYSVLDRNQVALPATGDRYFTHFDHWQKPLSFHEVVERASGLLAAH